MCNQITVKFLTALELNKARFQSTLSGLSLAGSLIALLCYLLLPKQYTLAQK